jgi:hypothetical protein
LAGTFSSARGVEQPSKAASGTAILRCRNTASGTTWTLAVDFEKSTVESFPAQITAGKIAWHDTHENRYYSFTRAAGILDIHYASSTGGFSGEEPCRLSPPGQTPPH